jgi:hypothetical protein
MMGGTPPTFFVQVFILHEFGATSSCLHIIMMRTHESTRAAQTGTPRHVRDRKPQPLVTANLGGRGRTSVPDI